MSANRPITFFGSAFRPFQREVKEAMAKMNFRPL
jgi:hypothetical protein